MIGEELQKTPEGGFCSFLQGTCFPFRLGCLLAYTASYLVCSIPLFLWLVELIVLRWCCKLQSPRLVSQVSDT